MRCATCEARTGTATRLEVTHVVQITAAATQRRLRCPACGARIVTVEQPVRVVAQPLAATAYPSVRT